MSYPLAHVLSSEARIFGADAEFLFCTPGEVHVAAAILRRLSIDPLSYWPSAEIIGARLYCMMYPSRFSIPAVAWVVGLGDLVALDRAGFLDPERIVRRHW